ncbi:restriction endonuclease subunit S [Vibrio cortegadensis]|uniref:Restriction endonuclease subunit S n=1 Tax=Vibrio cortegadensis TaxID=1328770 RepID=A0ABV4MBA2_9VIBR
MSCNQTLTISDIAQVFDGPHATPKKIEAGPYFLSISSLENGKLDLSKSAHVSDEDFKKWTRRVTPEEGDILFSYETRLGEVAMMPAGITACLGRRMGLLRPDRSKILPEYLLYAYQSPAFQETIRSKTIHGATVDRIALKELPSFQIQVPPLSVQEKIVNVLKGYDRKLMLNSETNQTLEEMAQAIFKSWFVDFDPVKAKMNGEQPEGMDAATASLFPEKLVESELGELPEGWKLVPVGELLANAIGGDWGKEVPDEKHTEEVRIVRGTDIPKLHGGAIDSVPVRYVESKKLKTRKLERGDIVIEVSGGSKDQPTGRSLFISDNILKRLDLPSEPASFCRRFKPVSYEIGLLLAVHFQLMYQAGKTWEYQNQSTGISNFQTKYFLEAEHVVIPSEDVLEAFIKQVNPMMDMIHSNQNIELAKLRDTLLPKLLSGEITLD